MVRLIRSGDCTIRDLVRPIASEMVASSPLRASYPRKGHGKIAREKERYLSFDKRILLSFE